MRDPEAVLAAEPVTTLINWSEPVGVLMFAVLHFVDDYEVARQTVRGYVEAAPTGSYLVVSHGTHETVGERGKQVERLYTRTDNPLTPRNQAQVSRLADGLELVEPGVVFLPSWRPDSPEEVEDHPERSSTYAMVARKV
jgi:hypothetical protein